MMAGVLCVVYLTCIVIETGVVADCAVSLQLPIRSGCNGADELCPRRYNEVAYATLHNAFSTTQNGIFFAQHRSCMRSALMGGMRGFMLDVHLTTSNTLRLCHSFCWLGSVSLDDTLLMFKEFRENNPREIVTIFIETGFDGRLTVDNSTKTTLSLLLKKSFELSGLVQFLFSHESATKEWPSLSCMIAQDRQIVVFVDAGRFSDEGVAPWLHCTCLFVSQTKWNLKTPKQLSEDCVFHRIWKKCRELSLINHFTIAGSLGINTGSLQWFAKLFSVSEIGNINHIPFLQDRVLSCSKCSGRFINFVAVDFWESSDVLKLVETINTKSTIQTSYPHHPDVAFCNNHTNTKVAERCFIS